MVSLCLTTKQFHVITVRQLYRTVSLDVGGPSDTRLAAFLNPRNIGLEWIRNIELYRAEVVDKCQSQMQAAGFAVRMIIEFLPENILEKFNWHNQTFSAENLVLLYRKQKKMKGVVAISLDDTLTDELKKRLDLDSIVENTTKLGLYPEDRNGLEFCHELLKRLKKADNLTLKLHGVFDEDDSSLPARMLNDSSTEPGLVTKTIFAHMLPFNKCTPMVLRELTLQKVHVRYASETYCKVIDFSKLKSLRVFSCSGADALFAELSKSARLPDKLETLDFKHEDQIRESDLMDALDGFLCLVSGIQRLTIDISYTKSLPGTSSIIRHSKTLRLLNIHAINGDPTDSDEEEHVYTAIDFAKILNSCILLEQLSLAFPPTVITRDYSDDYNLYMTLLLSMLPKLTTLNITTWPTNQPITSRLPRKKYEHLLQGMAQSGFESRLLNATRPTPSRLSVIAWGTSDKIFERENAAKNTIIFVKGKQIDPFGKEAPLAVSVGWCARKFVEPTSEVLDFELMRTVRPPTRETVVGDEEFNVGWGAQGDDH